MLSEVNVPDSRTSSGSDLLIFGQGPVIDLETREKPTSTDWSGKVTPNLWLENIVVAAQNVFQHGSSNIREIVVLGGRTGGQDYKSEAELAIEMLVSGDLAVPKENTRGENSSTNTLENLVNYCNEVLDNPDVPIGEKLDILGTPYHVNRMKLLMKLFGIPYENAFSSDEVLRSHARMKDGKMSEDASDWDNKTLNEIYLRLDVNEAVRKQLNNSEKCLDEKARGRGKIVGFYSDRKGTERKTIVMRRQEEDVWTRALLTMPDYSLPYFAKIQSDNRLRQILNNFVTHFFPVTENHPSILSERNIDIEHDSPKVVRHRLNAIERKLPDQAMRDAWTKEHIEKGWPELVETKFQNILT